MEAAQTTGGETRENSTGAPGAFTPLQCQFAGFVRRRYGASPPVALAAALTLRALNEGSTCFDCSRPGVGADPAQVDGVPDTAAWVGELERSPAVASATSRRRPLVLRGTLLSLQRYRVQEEDIGAFFHAACRAGEARIPPGVIAAGRALFAPPAGGGAAAIGGSLQCAGALLSFFFRAVLITGGPGTGKTTVLARLLLLHCEAALEEQRPLPRIVLGAPTGKAAQRMGESLRSVLGGSAVVEHCSPRSVEHLERLRPVTLHRLLGIVPGRGAARCAQDPLECDLAVVDECSMVDTELMQQLTAALPCTARLVLLGDRCQLPSIGPGRIVADLCSWQGVNRFSPSFAALVTSMAGAAGVEHRAGEGELSPVVELRHSYRFDATRAIGRVAAAVNAGTVARALEELEADQEGEASTCVRIEPAGSDVVGEHALALHAPLLQAITPGSALAALEGGMVLTAHNDGVWGRRSINRGIVQRFPSRLATPIMVTVNDPRRDLSNGDIGVLFGQAEERMAWFAHLDEPLAPFDLPPWEVAFAITIHKSQGSEFDAVVVVLPEEGALLSRELLYTALTRARRHGTIIGTRAAVAAAIENRNERLSGLFRE